VLYSTLADIYDRVMSHVEYGAWEDLIGQVLTRFGAASRVPVFEIGGGTGVLGRRLVQAGYHYQGSDRSEQMCRVALRRGLPFLCCDGRALPVRGPYGLVIFLYDGINYMMGAADYGALLREVHRVLEPGGLFLFDITTETNSRRYFMDAVDSEDLGDAAYLRHSHYDERTRIQHNDFTLFIRESGGERYIRSTESHCQRVLPFTEIRGFVPAELFEILGVWDGFSSRAAGRSSERVHFLLKAKRA
jgi:SAM-dependent methyltransferase